MQTSQDSQIYVNVTVTNVIKTQHHLTTKQISSLQHLRKIIIKVNNIKKMKEIRTRSTKQILRTIKAKNLADHKIIMSVWHLFSGNIVLHTADSQVHERMKRKRKWTREIAESTWILWKMFEVLMHEVHITMNMSNQKKVIIYMQKKNRSLHQELEILRVMWSKKVVKSNKSHSLIIVKVTSKMMTNQMLNNSFINNLSKCSYKLFSKDCRMIQCFKCHQFEHMMKACCNNLFCHKCENKYQTNQCVREVKCSYCTDCKKKKHKLWMRKCSE